jgi:hypothetical protein
MRARKKAAKLAALSLSTADLNRPLAPAVHGVHAPLNDIAIAVVEVRIIRIVVGVIVVVAIRSVRAVA